MCSDEVKENCLRQYNQELVDPIKPVTQTLMRVLPVITLVFAFLSFKKKHLADWLLSLELLL